MHVLRLGLLTSQQCTATYVQHFHLSLGRSEAALLNVRVYISVAADDEAKQLGGQATGGDGSIAFELPAQGRSRGERELRGAGLATSVNGAAHIGEGRFAMEQRPQVPLEGRRHDGGVGGDPPHVTGN
jgi:hypothetical protein